MDISSLILPKEMLHHFRTIEVLELYAIRINLLGSPLFV
jgi:hypothetical protein